MSKGTPHEMFMKWLKETKLDLKICQETKSKIETLDQVEISTHRTEKRKEVVRNTPRGKQLLQR